jgi:O-antigen ligase
MNIRLGMKTHWQSPPPSGYFLVITLMGIIASCLIPKLASLGWLFGIAIVGIIVSWCIPKFLAFFKNKS